MFFGIGPRLTRKRKRKLWSIPFVTLFLQISLTKHLKSSWWKRRSNRGKRLHRSHQLAIRLPLHLHRRWGSKRWPSGLRFHCLHGRVGPFRKCCLRHLISDRIHLRVIFKMLFFYADNLIYKFSNLLKPASVYKASLASPILLSHY